MPIVGDPIAQVKSPTASPARSPPAAATPSSSRCRSPPTTSTRCIRGLDPVGSVAGIIATVPHKFGLAAHCATLTDRARFLGSVNVARRNADGSWHGDQVDGAAFVAAILATAATPPARRALQVGAGGAGSAIALALLEAGAAELALHDADPGPPRRA